MFDNMTNPMVHCHNDDTYLNILSAQDKFCLLCLHDQEEHQEQRKRSESFGKRGCQEPDDKEDTKVTTDL